MQRDLKTRAALLRAPATPFENQTSSPFAAWASLLLGVLFILHSATTAQAGTLVGTVFDPSGRLPKNQLSWP